MRIKPKSVKAQVTLLRDPSPVAMALVDQGACQTPFNIVKRDSISTKEGSKMAKKLRLKKGKGAARDTVITKMHFSKSQFESEDDVLNYLSEKGVEGFTDVDDDDDVWVIKSEDDFEDITIGKAKSTPGLDDGVTVFIAPVEKSEPEEDDDEDDEEEEENASKADDEEDDDEEDDASAKKRGSKARDVKPIKKDAKKTKSKKGEEAAPAPLLMGELATKYDWWAGYMSNEKSLMDVVKDAMSYDALPPGMEEVSQALATATGNILADEDLEPEAKKAALAQVGAEFAGVTFDLSQLFAKAVVDVEKHIDKDVRTSAAKFVENFSDDVTAARKGTLFAAASTEEEEEEDDDTKGKASKSKKADTPEEDDVMVEVSKTLKAVVSRLGDIEETQKSHADLFSRQQRRKSLSESMDELISEEEDEDDDEEQKERTLRKSDLRSALGGRPRSDASDE